MLCTYAGIQSTIQNYTKCFINLEQRGKGRGLLLRTLKPKKGFDNLQDMESQFIQNQDRKVSINPSSKNKKSRPINQLNLFNQFKIVEIIV